MAAGRVMKIRAALVLLLTTLTFAGCKAVAAPADQTAGSGAAVTSEWRIGFWAWEQSWGGKYAVPRDALPIDDVYVQGQFGLFPSSPSVRAYWPDDLPSGRRYWALWRFEAEQTPLSMPDAAEGIGGRFASLRRAAAERHVEAAGVQIDFDCPTERLRDYAAWLSMLRKSLPPGTRLSITALLDWFRPGTHIADVLAQVTEFVPQFYDARPSTSAAMTIAEPIDALRWGPVFNRYQVPYRIGISTFGRVRLARGLASLYALGPSLLQILSAPTFVVAPASLTAAGERRLTLRARRATSIDWTRFEAGEAVEVVLPTRESVASAYAQARKMGGFCVGVIFFRWPADNESTVMAPAEVFRAVAGGPQGPVEDAVEALAGDCAAVRCSDVYLLLGDQFPDASRAFTLRASADLEYFLPQAKVGKLASMTARNTISVRLPAYHGETRLYLGRVMSKSTPQFTLSGESR
jgi:hypothetical protein